MEHFITEIQIRQLLHLSNQRISLSPHGRQNLILTGKNGSGLYLLIQQEPGARSAFTAFKRWLIWDNKAFLRELEVLCG